MRPAYGVFIELVLLSVVLGIAYVTEGHGLVSSFILLIVQGLTTYLIHCPTHYLVGSVFGIKFVRFGLGRTTLARALPPRTRSFALLLPVAYLSVDRGSAKVAASTGLSLMYASGMVASSVSAIVFAGAVVLSGDYIGSALTSVFAGVYLLSDLVASPKTGDLMRARAVVKSRNVSE